MAVIRAGTDLPFGISITGDGTNDGSVVTGYSQTTKRDIKEVKDMSGQTAAVAYYNQQDDITIDFAGAPRIAHHIPYLTTATAVLNAAYHGSAATEIYVDEVTVSLTNEGNRTTSIKATGYYS